MITCNLVKLSQILNDCGAKTAKRGPFGKIVTNKYDQIKFGGGFTNRVNILFCRNVMNVGITPIA